MKTSNQRKFKSKKSHISEEEFSLIKFKRKKTKANIRLGGKLFLCLMIAGAFFSSLTMQFKYKGIVEKFKESEISREDNSFNYTEVIKVISPSLVGISNSADKLMNNTYYNENLTGVILSDDGTILTNFSKVKGLDEIYVKLSENGTAPIRAEFIDGDENIDIAIIKIKYDGVLTPVKLAKVSDIRVGQSIAILSNSIGDNYIGNINPGIITSTSKKYRSTKNKEYDLLELSAPINKENTGGAVCNFKGELIGIASLDITNKNKNEGLFYAIDLGELEKIISSTTAFKSILGLTSGSIVSDADSEIKGFYVGSVKKGGNSYKAGIKPTDIVFEIEGINIITAEDILKVLKNKKVGDTINCKVMRNGNVEEIMIVLYEI